MSAPAVTAEARRSVRLVAWARAWRAGTVSYDDVIDETENGEEHLVADAPGTWRDVPLREGLQRTFDFYRHHMARYLENGGPSQR